MTQQPQDAIGFRTHRAVLAVPTAEQLQHVNQVSFELNLSVELDTQPREINILKNELPHKHQAQHKIQW